MKNLFKGIFVLLIFNYILCDVAFAKERSYNLADRKQNNKIEVAVVVKDEGIWAVNINKPSEKIIINSGNYREPIISENGYVAYRDTKDNLYIAKIDFHKKVDNNINVDDNVTAYQWNKDGNLIYSKSTGGAYIFGVKDKTKEALTGGKEFYTQILLGKDNSLFAVKNIIKKSNSDNYPFPLGIVKLDLASKKEKVVVPYIPINSQNHDLGLNPKMATISINGVNLIVWCRPNSASMTADGVPIGVYNDESNKCRKILNQEIIVLTYEDMMSVSPINDNLVAIINGAYRFMNVDKTLGILNLEDDSFKKITKDGEVAMTPNYSSDGSKIIYSASAYSENLQQWESSNNQHIYEVNLENNEITKLTNSSMGWDFYPNYINDDSEFVFIRKDKENKFYLVKGNREGKEQVIIDNILNTDDSASINEYFWYYGHYDMKKVFNNMEITQ
ncbi:hypothetical protein [Clostridium sp. UBA7503]|uniref:TolB family protein n=1 Tax=Clostridium sp. UBA7503 TaxID=1946377 RepID=UPI0032164559